TGGRLSPLTHPSRHRRGNVFAQAERTAIGLLTRTLLLQGELQTFQTQHRPVMPLDHGQHFVPIGAAEITTDDNAFGLSSLHASMIGEVGAAVARGGSPNQASRPLFRSDSTRGCRFLPGQRVGLNSWC